MLLLGLGEQLARQWWPRPVPQGAQQEDGIEVTGPCTAPAADAHLTVHERRAAYSRRVLAQRLKARYPWVDEELRRRDLVTSQFAAYLDDRDPSADTVAADRSQRSNHEQDLRIFLTTTSLCELELLLMERGNDAATSRAVRDVVSLRSLKLVLPWGIIRTARAIRAAHPGRSDLMRKAGESVVYSGSRPQIMPGRGERLLDGGWPPNLEVLRQYVTSVLGSSRLHSWHEHYNAACTYALPLLDEQVPAALTEQSTAQGAAADAAVAQLHKAVACGDSGFLAAQREWLLTEDPDLDVLRGTQQFFDLEAATFGSVSATESRGPHLVTWQIRTYATGLVHHVARCMRVEWAQRPSSGRAEREQVATWIELETAAWQIIERLCHEHDDSAERHRAVAALRSSGSAVLTTPSQVHPRFSRTLLAHQYDSLRTGERARPPAVQQQVRTVIDRSTLRFAGTVHALRSQQRGTAECCSRARELTPVRQAQRIRATLDPHATPQPEAVTSAGEVQRWAERSHACWIAMDALFDDANPQPATMPVRLTDLRTALAR